MVIFHLNTAYSRQVGLDDLGLSLLGGKNTLGSPAWWLVRLDLGVKVFFAISGMVLALPFLRQYILHGPKVDLGDYFYRRLTRLEPPFVLSLLVFLIVNVILLGEGIKVLMPHFWTGLLYAHVLVYGYPNPINPVTWSLETEAQFYAIVPIFFGLLFLRRANTWAVAVLLVSFIASVWLRGYFIQQGITQLGSSLFAYFSNFLVGILVAWLYLKRQDFFILKGKVWDLLGLIAIAGQFFFYKPQHQYVNNILFNICILLLMLATFKGNLLNWFFTRPLVYIIGGMCYSIYLLHYAFFHLVVQYTARYSIGMGYGLDLLVQMAVGIPLALMISGMFYTLVEKPCMDKYWPKKLIQFLKANLIK